MRLTNFSLQLACTAALLLAAAPTFAAEPAAEPGADATVVTRTANSGQLVMQDVPEIPADLRAALRQYQNTRRASLAGWSADGQSLFIKTRFGNVDQLHRIEKPGGARHQLTFFAEPVGSVYRAPGASDLLITRDAGGNEFSQIFSFDPDTAALNMLTDGESRNGWVVHTRDGQAFAFQSTRRDGRANDIWMMQGNDPASAKLLFPAPDGHWWAPSDFTRDGKTLIVQEYVSSIESRIHTLDLTAADPATAITNLNPDAPTARRYAVGLTADDSALFYLSDEGSEYTRLLRRDLASGDETIVGASLAGLNWDVASATLSQNRRCGAFQTNEGGISKVYLFDPKSLKATPLPKVPQGIVGAMIFSPDCRRLALSIDGATSPGDVYVVEVKSGAPTQWTFSEVGGLNTAEFVAPETIEYTSFDGLKVPAFVYKPQDASKQAPAPVIISIHGGPEAQARPYFSSTYQLWLKQLGAAVVVPNVRGSAGYGKTYVAMDNGLKRYDSVKDIGALLDWIATQPELDASRVAVIGGSYGGFMVLASAVEYSDRLRAAVDIVGISDFATFLKNTQDYRRDLRRAEYGDERDPQMAKFFERIAPANNVDQIKIPLFVVQGNNDPRVPVSEAEQIVKAVRGTGQTVWYMNALDEGHGYRKKANRDEYQLATMLFFQQHLLGE